MNRLAVGILGCGKMGRVYSDWFSRNPRTRVAALYNRTHSRAESLAGEVAGSEARRAWQEITRDPEVDIIGICTSSNEHREQWLAALAAGKHVLCEKPMARDLSECGEMVAAASAAPVKVAIGFQMRHHPVIRKVGELLPEIGRLFHLDFVFGMYRPEITWRHDICQGGGVLKELGSHLLDLACCWAGEVSAITARNRILRAPREVEDYSVNLLEFASGVTGYLSTNYFDRRDRCIHGHLMGTDGQIVWQFSPYDPADSRVALLTNSGERQDVPIPIPETIDKVYPGHLDSFGREINEFVDCIVHDREPTAGPAAGMRAMEITAASYESTRLNKRIELPLGDFDPETIDEGFDRFEAE